MYHSSLLHDCMLSGDISGPFVLPLSVYRPTASSMMGMISDLHCVTVLTLHSIDLGRPAVFFLRHNQSQRHSCSVLFSALPTAWRALHPRFPPFSIISPWFVAPFFTSFALTMFHRTPMSEISPTFLLINRRLMEQHKISRPSLISNRFDPTDVPRPCSLLMPNTINFVYGRPSSQPTLPGSYCSFQLHAADGSPSTSTRITRHPQIPSIPISVNASGPVFHSSSQSGFFAIPTASSPLPS